MTSNAIRHSQFTGPHVATQPREQLIRAAGSNTQRHHRVHDLFSRNRVNEMSRERGDGPFAASQRGCEANPRPVRFQAVSPTLHLSRGDQGFAKGHERVVATVVGGGTRLGRIPAGLPPALAEQRSKRADRRDEDRTGRRYQRDERRGVVHAAERIELDTHPKGRRLCPSSTFESPPTVPAQAAEPLREPVPRHVHHLADRQTPGTPSNPGGTFPGTVIASDGFARVGALVDSTMHVGSSAYAGTAGILTTDGDHLVTSATASAIVAAGMRPREGADFAAKVPMWITSKATANRQVKWYAVRKDATNDVEIAYAGSTTITITVVVRVGGTARTVGIFPAGTISSNTDPADYPFELSLSGSSLTAKVNSATLGPFTVTSDEVTAVAGMTSTDFTSLGEPSWSADALEVRGTVVVAPSGGSAPVPSTLSYATVYNGAIAGSTIESQRTRLPQIMPQAPRFARHHPRLNYATTTPEAFLAAIDEFLADLAAVHGPGIPVAVMSENPCFTGDANETAHRQRQVALRAAARARGWLYLPGFEAYARLADGGKSYVNATDGVHPKRRLYSAIRCTAAGGRREAHATGPQRTAHLNRPRPWCPRMRQRQGRRQLTRRTRRTCRRLVPSTHRARGSARDRRRLP